MDVESRSLAMKIEEVIRPLGLENKHIQFADFQIPVIESSIYTTFGRRLFELYDRYEINPEDQREIERLSFLLMIFTLERDRPTSLWARVKRIFKRA